MKREREEVLISSDEDEDEDEDEEGSEEDWEEDADGEDDDDEDDDDDDDDDGDDDIDEYSLSEDDDDSNNDDHSDNDNDDLDEDEDNDDAHSSDSEQALDRKARKRVTSGFYGTGGAESAQQGKKWTRQKHKPTMRSGHARSRKKILSKEDQKLFSDALNIIRGGESEKLKLEHCKAYLRRYSLRLAGSSSVLFDRVQEHIELKAHGGMAKYPKSTFTMNCTGDACTGDIVLFQQKVKRNYVKAGASSMLPRVAKRIVAGRIVKESYGSDKQQHTFTVEVLWSKGPNQLPVLYPLLIKGRNLYRYRTSRQRWSNEQERKKVIQEKHSRGDVARNARECRVSGKRYSCTSKTRIPNKRARVDMRKESIGKAGLPQVHKAASKFRAKAWSNATNKGTERSLTSTVRSFVRDHDNRSHVSYRRTLTIKACYAGMVIGTQGRNIGAITRASGAELRVCDHPSSSTLRVVEIFGAFEQVQVAARMVVQSFLDRGLSPPVEIVHC